MKRILVILCLLLLTSCSKKVVVNNDNVLVHKWSDLETIEDLSEATNGHFGKPSIVGVSQERYVTMQFDDGLVGQSQDARSVGKRRLLRCPV